MIVKSRDICCSRFLRKRDRSQPGLLIVTIHLHDGRSIRLYRRYLDVSRFGRDKDASLNTTDASSY